MKICFVSIFSYPLFDSSCNLNFGGSEVQVSLLTKELSKDDNYDVNLVVADTGQDEFTEFEGVKIHKSFKRGEGFFNKIIAPFQLYRTLKKINPDIVVSRAAGVEIGINAFYAKFNKKKFIYSLAHDKDIDGSRFSGVRGRVFKYGLDNADILITQSGDQDLGVEKLYNTKRKKVLIKNSFNILNNDISVKKHILWVSRAAKLKRPEYFLDLVKYFPKERFVMIMPKGDMKLWNKIKHEADNIENLEFIEKVAFDNIQKYFDKAKVFVNTSSAEGFPNTFLQSACAGTPLLSLKVDPDQFIKKNKVGLMCDDDIETMKNNLTYLLNNQSDYNEMSKNIIDYVKNNHDINVNIKKWKNIFFPVIPGERSEGKESINI